MLATVNHLVYHRRMALSQRGEIQPEVSERGEQILTAAAGLFARRGFHAVSIDEIGAEVGISGPGLYRHFANKQAMLAAMLIRISQTLLDEGRRRVEAAPTPSAALTSLVQWHVQFALTNPELIVVQDRDRSSLSTAGLEQVRTLQRRYIELWVDVGRQLDRQLSAPTARAAVQAVFGLINSTPHSARIDARAMARLLEAMALAAFGAVPAAQSDRTGRGMT
ncbi:MAG: transcriptional regulator, TetR family [Pseudonocardiales bacterium]|nr:transcriptional regulator, TetR family [Pseudonocardiales bacterium]